MRKSYRFTVLSVLFSILLFIAADAAPAVISIQATRDNTIYSESGSLSNGIGANFFAGRVSTTGGGAIRRALVSFPVRASLPTCAVIQGVTLRLSMSRTISGAETVSLHKVLENWGQGTSDATANEGTGASATTGDATWTYAFYNTTLWPAAGGNFSSTVSASVSVGAVGFYSWSSAQMIADVQEWTNNDATNFGWIVIGNEATTATTKRFDSRENATVANRPVLEITYFDCTPVEPTTWGTIKEIFR